MNAIVWIFATLGATAVAVVLVFFVHTWRDRRRRRLAYEEALRRFEARPRGRVLRIGTVVVDALGREHPWGFELDCEGKVPGQSIGLHGEILIGGYTTGELVEMAKRRAEFDT